jgi:hypothetical protein
MSAMRVLRAGGHAQVPWKNGLGVSAVIATEPAGAGYDTLDWQVATTGFAAEGPFSALAGLEQDYAETAATCAPAGAKRASHSTETPPKAESISVLDGISKILSDGAYLDAAYATHTAQCDRTQTQPEPAALWISKAASAEVEKAKDLLMLTRMEEATPKRRQVAAPGPDAQP